MSRPKSVLITGVTGFIGAALARRLIAEGMRVFGLVRPESRRERLTDLPKVELVESANSRRESLAGVLSQVRPDAIFNLAAAGVAAGDNDPGPMFECNVQLVLSLVQAIAETGPATLIQAGSCAEYGAQATDGPIDESAPLHPLSYYGSTKAAAGLLAQNLAQQLGVDLTVLRLFNVYGPGEGPRRLAPYIIHSLARGEPADLTPGTQVRDFLFIDDATSALWTAANCQEQLRGQPPHNVCSGQPVSVRQFGQTLAELMQQPQSLLRWGAKPGRTNEPERIVGNSERFRRSTGWRPEVSLREGLQKTIDYQLSREFSGRKAA